MGEKGFESPYARLEQSLYLSLFSIYMRSLLEREDMHGRFVLYHTCTIAYYTLIKYETV